jgi:hypothetical protein
MSAKALHRASIAVALLLALVGGYFAIWMIASADLAFIPCNNRYSLFSASLRCRVPYITMILAAVFFLLALGVALYGRRWSVTSRKKAGLL